MKSCKLLGVTAVKQHASSEGHKEAKKMHDKEKASSITIPKSTTSQELSSY